MKNTKFKTTTVKGIENLPSGSYRVRKMVKGKTFTGVFKKRKDAITYKESLNGK